MKDNVIMNDFVRNKTISPYRYAKEVMWLSGYTVVFCAFVTFCDIENLFAVGLKSSPALTFVMLISILGSVISATARLFMVTARRFRTLGESPWKSLWLLLGLSFPYYFARLTIGSPSHENGKLKQFRSMVAVSFAFIVLPFVFESAKSSYQLNKMEIVYKKEKESEFYRGKTEGYRSMLREFRDAFPELLSKNHWDLMEKIKAEKDDRNLKEKD